MNLNEMERLAREATQDWSADYPDAIEVNVDCMSHCYGGTGKIELPSGKEATYKDYEYIASVSPDVVLKMIERIRAADEMAEGISWSMQYQNDQTRDAYRKYRQLLESSNG